MTVHDSERTITMVITPGDGWVSMLMVMGTVSLNLILGSDKPVAQFEGKDTLLRPVGYREWVFVGSSLGLRYNQNAGEKSPSKSEPYHNVYINPAAYREFSNTGKFPEGTMMILELAKAESKNEPGLQGSYQKDYLALEASVKDSKRFEGGWAYFSFTDKDGNPKSKAQPFVTTACWSCHHQKAATDHVFTQFYPVLRAVMRK